MAQGELSQEDIDALLSRAADRARQAVGGEKAPEQPPAPARPAPAPASAAAPAPPRKPPVAPAPRPRPTAGRPVAGAAPAAAPAPAAPAAPPPRPMAGAASKTSRGPVTSTRLSASTVEAPEELEELLDIELDVRIRLGEAVMPIEEVAALGEGSVVELDRATGDPVDILVNDRPIARGEVVIVDDRFTVRISEIIAPEARSRME